MAPNGSKKHTIASEKSFFGPGIADELDAHSHAYPPPPQQHMHAQQHTAANNYNQNNNIQLQPNLHRSGPGPVLAPSPAGFGPSGPGPGPGNADLQQQHRTTQSYQNVAPLPHFQQSRSLNRSQTPQQPPYASPNLYTPQSALQSPFLNGQQQFQAQQGSSDAPGYYPPNQSPRSQSSAAGPYYSTEKPDSMAAAATMQRPYPPIYTPQSNSPASVASPQSHDHGRPMYGQPGPQLGQPLYGYPQYQSLSQVHQPPYGGHHAQTQQHQMSSQPMLYQTTSSQMTQGQVAPHHSAIASSPRLKTESAQSYQQTPQARTGILPQQQPPQHTPTTPQTPALPQSQQQQQQQQTPSNMPPNSNAAPGPIPATTPLVVRQDNNGVQWISFEYSRDRVKMEYTIRCDVESVDANALSQEFKSENCVYPRACVPKEQYKGNRLAYETDCNQVGWALAELNPCLRGKRGLIQRAVDSWRNSNQDPRLRSRRVRRQAKMNNRSKMTPTAASQPPGPPGPVQTGVPTGLPGPNSMPAPSTRPPGALPSAPNQILHHHPDVSPAAHSNVGASPYNTTPQAYRQDSASQHMPSPNDIRQSHVFPGYANYPQAATSMAPSMAPPMQGGLHHLGRPGGTAAMTTKELDGKNEDDNALFGDLPESKRRKFILVEDTQKNARVRVKVTLDQIEMSEIPDSYRKQNSVFPRAYFPVQMQTAPEASRGDRFVEEGEEVDGGPPTLGKTVVSVQTVDGEAEVDVPQISKSKRGREQKLNELGHRMAWGQGRVFSGRPIFLARALDAYRSKQRNALLAAGSEPSSIPAHLESRPGKRKWLERTKAGTQPMTPPTTASE